MFKPTPEQIRSWLEANFQVKVRKGGRECLINSPFDDDTGFNFGVNTELGVAHSWHGDEWAKGKSKTFLRFVQVYRNCSFIEAVREVCGKDATLDSIYKRVSSQASVDPARIYDISMPAGSLLLTEQKNAMAGKMLLAWLKSRGVTEEMVDKYKLHSHGMYVVWPYYEYGSLVYWQERDRLNKSFRFPSEEDVGVSKGMFLYGFDMAEPNDYVIVVEAIFGSMTLGDQCLASGGAPLTEHQVRKLRALNPVNGIILAPDNDSAGVKSLMHNYRLLCPYFSKLFYALPPKLPYNDKFTKDVNELEEHLHMPKSEIRAIFEKSIRPLTMASAMQFAIQT